MGVARPHLILALGVLAIAALILALTPAIPSPAYVKIGPRVFPYGVGALLALCGAGLAWRALRGGWECEVADPRTPPLDFTALAWLGAGLLCNVALIGPIGFVVASPIMFVLVARAFGLRDWAKAMAWGAGLTLIAYIGFARLLQIRIGTGLVDGWLDRLLDLVL